MTLRTESINKFINAMLDSEEKFVQGIKSYEDKQKEIENIFQELKNNIAVLSETFSSNDDNANIILLKKKISLILNECIEKGTHKIYESSKGMNFIRKHEKTFVVSVFGKVKSGKSSLGNFVMGTDLKKLKVCSDYDRINPVVTVEDRGKITMNTRLETLSEDDEGFGVGSTETTSTIQYFKIGGLTWFDTPGIGSITKENEELAKEYIQNSDLVIFTCSSDAAGTQQEFSEMKRFSEIKKPVLLLVTMSDTYEEDIDDDGNIVKVLFAKSERDRKDVEDYLINSIREQNLDDILKYSSIMTISKQLAVEAFKAQDDEKYSQSNMNVFLEKLIEITQNEAGKMKLATPMKRINTMISDIIGNDDLPDSLTGLKNTILENIKDIDKQIQALELKKDNIRSMIKSESINRIQGLMSSYSAEIKNGGRNINSERISNDIIQIIAEESKKICENELSDFVTENSIKLFDNMKENGFSIPDMKMQTESISYKQEYVETKRRAPRGLFENLGSFFFKREYFENSTRTVTKYSTFDVGINESEIWSAVNSQINIYFEDNVEIQIKELINMYFTPIKELQNKSVNLIDNTIQKLLEIRTE